jgi:small subunit ribosomal protein S1
MSQQGEENFADMLATYDKDAGDSLKVGDKVRGSIIAIDDNSVFVDVGAKVDGVAERAELLSESGELGVDVGDELELYVVNVGSDGVRLSKALSGDGGLEALREAYESQLPVEGKVTSTCKGGFNVEVAGRRAFCPVSQIDATFVEDPEQFVGQTLSFQVITFEQDGRNVVLSRRRLLEKERQAAMDEFMARVQPGETIEGKVMRLAQFGAFVEIVPGLEGLVHVSELGHGRVDKPEDVVAVGDEVTAKVLSIEPQENKPPRIGLSIKQTLADPWETVAENYKEGDKVEATITRLADFGAFAEIAPGLEGLIHISEMSYTNRVHKAADVVSPGETHTVVVKSVDPVRRRLGLSLRDAVGDPWMQAPSTYPVGTVLDGTVEKHERFGIFVQLEPGVTGLLPKSKLERSASAKDLEQLQSGQPIPVRVDEINTTDRKITLSPTDVEAGSDWGGHQPRQRQSQDRPPRGAGGKPGGRKKPQRDDKPAQGIVVGDAGGFGSLGDKLREAMEKKK